jgi:hypothetical protein
MVRRIYYDTEFYEDGKQIHPISIGMVDHNGRELYLVNATIDQSPDLRDAICRHDWLMDNVIPLLPLQAKTRPTKGVPHLGLSGGFHLDDTDLRVVAPREIRNRVRAFILAEPDTQVELWAWHGAYDHVLLAQLFGPMAQLPGGVPMWTHELQQEIDRIGVSYEFLPRNEGNSHNALDDARQVRAIHQYLRTQSGNVAAPAVAP